MFINDVNLSSNKVTVHNLTMRAIIVISVFSISKYGDVHGQIICERI